MTSMNGSDQELLAKVTEFVKQNPTATRSVIFKTFKTSIERLTRIGAPLPPKMSASDSGRLGKSRGWGSPARRPMPTTEQSRK